MLKLAEKRRAAQAAAEAEEPDLDDLRGETLRSVPSRPPAQAAATAPRQIRQEARTVATALTEHLAELGVRQAFGVSGGAIALVFDALVESPIELAHFRHETGAAFAATEAYFASRRPTVVFTTTGPGLLNSLTGLTAARWDGAKVILISGATSAPQRGRWATQETSSYSLPQDGLYTQGPLFDFATRVESPAELPEVFRRLALGVARPGTFVAHVSIPMGVQSKRIDQPRNRSPIVLSAPAPAADDVETCLRLLRRRGFAIWAGFGATGAADKVRELAERMEAKVYCSPRAKGILPEDHPSFLGVTGLGGYGEVTEYLMTQRPRWVLVLGTRLGEPTSFWDRDLLPREGFIHVDLDPQVPGTAYPDTRTIGIQAEVGNFLDALLQRLRERQEASAELPSTPESKDGEWPPSQRHQQPVPLPLSGRVPVRPQLLMSSLQRHVVRGSDAVVLAECGNSFAWCNHYLRFSEPGRYRVSTLFGSMGHAAAGVVGAALARGGKAVAVVGDGAMLMNAEVSTAVQYRAQAVWVVLNDAGYGMCRDGHRALALTNTDFDIPRVDFVAWAKSMGADAARAETEEQVDSAVCQAMAAEGPFLIDVRIDGDEPSPLLKRFESLIKQGNSKNVAGWEK